MNLADRLRPVAAPPRLGRLAALVFCLYLGSLVVVACIYGYIGYRYIFLGALLR